MAINNHAVSEISWKLLLQFLELHAHRALLSTSAKQTARTFKYAEPVWCLLEGRDKINKSPDVVSIWLFNVVNMVLAITKIKFYRLNNGRYRWKIYSLSPWTGKTIRSISLVSLLAAILWDAYFSSRMNPLISGEFFLITYSFSISCRSSKYTRVVNYWDNFSKIYHLLWN